MRVLLTGADGFVGAHILDYLLEHTDAHVVCMVSGNHPARRLPLILSKHENTDRARVVRHDLTTPINRHTDRVIGHVNAVIDAASSTDIGGSISDPASVFVPNVTMTAHLADWARDHDLDAFVHLSSEEVYGPAYNGPHSEWEPVRPSTHYSASKAAQEAYLTASWRSHGLPLVLLNLMNQIGPMQDPTKLVPTIIRRTLAGESVPLLVDWYEPQSGSGEESVRQYMHPRRVASAVLHVLGDPDRNWSPRTRLPARYNVAGEQIGNVALASMIAAELGRDLKWEPVPADGGRPGHERVFALDDSKLRAAGWVPPTSLEDDVRDTVNWYKEHTEWLV